MSNDPIMLEISATISIFSIISQKHLDSKDLHNFLVCPKKKKKDDSFQNFRG